MTFSFADYLGEPSPGYQPRTNPLSFEEGSVGFLQAEENTPENHFVWGPEGGRPAGLEVSIPVKGEQLLIQ